MPSEVVTVRSVPAAVTVNSKRPTSPRGQIDPVNPLVPAASTLACASMLLGSFSAGYSAVPRGGVKLPPAPPALDEVEPEVLAPPVPLALPVLLAPVVLDDAAWLLLAWLLLAWVLLAWVL